MNILGVLDTDLQETPLGTRSRLADELVGTPVLRRTVERIASCRGLNGMVVCCPPAQVEAVARLVQGTPARVRARQAPPAAYRNLVRVARKWSLEGWRGGLGGCTALDEYVDPVLCALLAGEEQAAAIAVFAPGAALTDPVLVDAMLDHARAHAEDSKLTFAQAPPGLLPTVFQASLCVQLAEKRVPAGWTLAYKPDDPGVDLVFRACNFPVSQAVRYASGRLTADTARAWRLMQRLIAAGAASAEAVGNHLLAEADQLVDPLPHEVEIELTTEDPLPDVQLRPRGARVPARGPIALELIAKLAAELVAADDDALVVLGGFGDPVCHPQFAEVVRMLRSAGVYGLAVQTTGQRLDEAARAALTGARVDVAIFQLDAWHDATYAHLTGGADLGRAKQALAALAADRERLGQVEPILVPQFTKAAPNVEELDVFYDGWMRAQGCASIVGFSHFGGRLTDLSVMNMAPPQRAPCRRIHSRCVVLADGRVVACDQDYTGALALGNLANQSLGEIWHGAAASRLRNRHVSGAFADGPLCGSCCEWHRP